MGENLIKSFSSSFFADLLIIVNQIINRIDINDIVKRGYIFNTNKTTDNTQNNI